VVKYCITISMTRPLHISCPESTLMATFQPSRHFWLGLFPNPDLRVWDPDYPNPGKVWITAVYVQHSMMIFLSTNT